MSHPIEIRWKKRFENYEKAFKQLERFVAKTNLNEFEEQGLIKCFENTYELAWKTMKDFLSYQGVIGITGSRDAIRQAFSKELIENGEQWMKMIEDRIRTVHTYDEETAKSIISNIYLVYFPLFDAFYNSMKSRV